ncbi:Uma2 family endonuclease [Pseudanabaena sp. CCNP1317]|jgi:Uma2 family endonuclease|nr:Uma2 family endonuclease [Pseudanabaena sp. CCNP1317]MEA5489555.1 Uma2 family endonuclease [Pseudanabaena sp. CCNP1317]
MTMTIAEVKPTSQSVNQVPVKKLTFAEFLEFSSDTEILYELENGELIEMASESEINQRIAMFLVACFLQLGISYGRLRMKTEIAVHSRRVGVRVPDLVIFSEELEAAMQGATRSLVLMDMPPPLLVVEIVSPNQESRDYRYKRSEYAARGIMEYWIVDPIAQKLTILQWVEGFYDELVFTGETAIASPLLGELDLTAAKLWQS